MVGEDRVVMSAKELRRVHVIRQVREKRLTQRRGGNEAGGNRSADPAPPSAGRAEGDRRLVHRGRGKPSNRRIPETRKTKVLKLYDALGMIPTPFRSCDWILEERNVIRMLVLIRWGSNEVPLIRRIF